MSSMDQSKWKKLVQSFNPSALESIESNINDSEGEFRGDPAKEEVTDFDALYTALKHVVQERGMQDSVEITRGDGFTFISFRDKVFF